MLMGGVVHGLGELWWGKREDNEEEAALYRGEEGYGREGLSVKYCHGRCSWERGCSQPRLGAGGFFAAAVVEIWRRRMSTAAQR